MSKVASRIGAEVALLRRYAVEVWKQREAILDSAMVVAALWLTAHFGASLTARVIPHMPKAVAPWLTQNRLIVLSLFLVFGVAQYRAWREAWLNRGTPEKPHLPKGMRLVQAPFHDRSSTKEGVSEETQFELFASEDLRGKAIRIYCDGPIYFATASFIADPDNDQRAGRPHDDIRPDDMNSIIFNFSSEWFAARPFTKIEGEMSSVAPIRITRVEWVEANP